MSPKVRQVSILVIMIVLVIGTLGGFISLILTSNNQQSEIDQQAEAQQLAFEAQQKESGTFYPIFKEYQDDPAAFDAASVGEAVTFKDLKEGTGETVTKDLAYKAYYIGWNPSGKTFDSSFAGESLKPAINTGEIQLIPGWYNGVEGMKIGGVREITIPAALAYGESGGGEDIPPNTPIKFIVMAAEKSS